MKLEECLKENERIDDTGFGDIKVIQLEGLGYGVDAVLLAAFAAGETGAKAARPAARVLDLGSGSGIIGMVLAHKIPGLTVVGVDKRADSVDRASRAVKMCGLSDRIRFECAEIKGYGASHSGNGTDLNGSALNGAAPGGARLDGSGGENGENFANDTTPTGGENGENFAKPASNGSAIKYDVVVSNPPYFKRNAAIPSATDGKFIARHETTAVIADFIAAADRSLERGGDLYMVHRPDRLADIICELRSQRIEPKELQFVAPRAGEAPNIVLIHAIKGAGAELRLLPEIAVHTSDGGYTEIINKIYER